MKQMISRSGRTEASGTKRRLERICLLCWLLLDAGFALHHGHFDPETSFVFECPFSQHIHQFNSTYSLKHGRFWDLTCSNVYSCANERLIFFGCDWTNWMQGYFSHSCLGVYGGMARIYRPEQNDMIFKLKCCGSTMKFDIKDCKSSSILPSRKIHNRSFVFSIPACSSFSGMWSRPTTMKTDRTFRFRYCRVEKKKDS